MSRRCLKLSLVAVPVCVYFVIMISALGQLCLESTQNELELGQSVLASANEGRTEKKHRRRVFEQGNRPIKTVLQGDSSVRLEWRPKSDLSNEPPVLKEPAVHDSWLYNCSSISRMKVKHKIGHGVSKQTFLGEIDGVKVAIKMVTRHIQQVRSCLANYNLSSSVPEFQRQQNDIFGRPLNPLVKQNQRNQNSSAKMGLFSQDFRERFSHDSQRKDKQEALKTEQAIRQSCYVMPTARLMKEVLLSSQLRHRNLASLLGYCVRSEESETTDISEHGVVSVYELGSRVTMDSLQFLPWQQRLRHALEMADLLHYLQSSPLGSLVVPDFKEDHLLLVGGHLKLIDLDDVNNLEPECSVNALEQPACQYSLPCVGALCRGFNAKANMDNMNRFVFKRLLFPTTFPARVVKVIGQVNARLDDLSMDASQLMQELLYVGRVLRVHGT